MALYGSRHKRETTRERATSLPSGAFWQSAGFVDRGTFSRQLQREQTLAELDQETCVTLEFRLESDAPAFLLQRQARRLARELARRCRASDIKLLEIEEGHARLAVVMYGASESRAEVLRADLHGIGERLNGGYVRWFSPARLSSRATAVGGHAAMEEAAPVAQAAAISLHG